MRLTRDHSAGARESTYRVPCYQCGKMIKLRDSLIDRDGPSFRAYYCEEHLPALAPGTMSREIVCPNRDCAICH